MSVYGSSRQYHHDPLSFGNRCFLCLLYATCCSCRPSGIPAGKDLDIPLNGYVYCYPAKSNYLGGDIISGMIETELYKKDGISVFFDIGTNGELVIGNKDFLLCGAGAAGPALEGGVVHTGMRADAGAVDSVRIRGGKIHVHVIGNSSRKN